MRGARRIEVIATMTYVLSACTAATINTTTTTITTITSG
jgi:hypothetical protein